MELDETHAAAGGLAALGTVVLGWILNWRKQGAAEHAEAFEQLKTVVGDLRLSVLEVREELRNEKAARAKAEKQVSRLTEQIGALTRENGTLRSELHDLRNYIQGHGLPVPKPSGAAAIPPGQMHP